MKWSELPLHPSRKILRQFAGMWLVFFGCLAAHQGLVRNRPLLGLGIGVAAVVVGGLGLFRPAAVRWVFVGWMVLVFPLGWLISQVLLLLLFFGLITPVALLFRLKGRDVLRRKPGGGLTTFWMNKEPPQDLRRYFRQY
ncbi:MAG: SxtJ family membrane protein [Verrucomicrobia bacterium]|nr:SxtJ family membrane protein [Verrucomicrobiota bacterium]